MKMCANDTHIAAVLRQLQTSLPIRHSRNLLMAAGEPRLMVPIVLVAEGRGPRSSPLPTPKCGPAFPSQTGGAFFLRRADNPPQQTASMVSEPRRSHWIGTVADQMGVMAVTRTKMEEFRRLALSCYTVADVGHRQHFGSGLLGGQDQRRCSASSAVNGWRGCRSCSVLIALAHPS